MLVLQLTDHNKLLMQWKDPFQFSAVVGLNDYKVSVKGKERIYHANLLKSILSERILHPLEQLVMR